MLQGEGADRLTNARQRIAPVPTEMPRKSGFGQKKWFHGDNFCRCLATVEFAQQNGDALDDRGIGIACELAMTRTDLAREPEPR